MKVFRERVIGWIPEVCGLLVPTRHGLIFAALSWLLSSSRSLLERELLLSVRIVPIEQLALLLLRLRLHPIHRILPFLTPPLPSLLPLESYALIRRQNSEQPTRNYESWLNPKTERIIQISKVQARCNQQLSVITH